MSQKLNLEHLKGQAKDLLKSWRDGASQDRKAPHLAPPYKLSDAQWVIAQELGFPTWATLKHSIELPRDLSKLSETWVNQCLGVGYQFPKRDLARETLSLNPQLSKFDAGHAALAGDLDHLAMLLDSSPKLLTESFTHQAIPLICLAAASLARDGREVQVMDHLLKLGADPNTIHHPEAYPDASLAPLYWASGVARSTPVIKRLLEAGANPDDGESLYHGVESDDQTIMEALARAGAPWTGNALARLLDFEDPARLRRALELGADPNYPESGSHSLFHALVRGRSFEVIKTLIEAGADLSRIDSHGKSVYVMASVLGRRDVVQLLEERGVKEELTPRFALVSAAASGDEALARSMIDADPNLFAQLTPLDYIALPSHAALGNFEAVKAMINLGWPIQVRHTMIGTSANHAAFGGWYRVLEFLIAHGATWTEKNDYGGDVWGSIYWASSNLGSTGGQSDHVACARVLLEAGSPVPDIIGGSEEVREFLENWLADHPDWPREELS